ncbi:MAG: hypothetical protein R2825_04115 [Saprospiraceae bacterium]
MENNLHNDGLDDFLRKSFEQYDDSPSDGLWDKIEADLTDEPKVVPIRTTYRWWATAAAALFLALVVGQHIYFQKEKTELIDRINAQAKKIETLEKELINKETTEIKIAKNNGSENIFNDNKEPINSETNSFSENSKKNKPNNNYSKENKSSTVHLISEQPNFIENKNNNTDINKIEKNNLIENNNEVETIAKIGNNDLIENNNEVEIIAGQQKLIAPNSLDLIGLKNIDSFTPNLSLPTTPIIPAVNSGKFSIGIHHSHLSTREKMARVIQRPLIGPNRIFNNTSAMTGTTQVTGIGATYKTKNNWLLESGLNYRKTNLSTSHHAQLRFMDRRPDTNNQQHDFVYALNTSAGIVDIEVRADQTDPTETINEFENITINIKADQAIEYVSIPLLIGKQLGYGRFNTTIKSGFLFNFLTSQSLDISGSISNSKLRSSRTVYSRRNGIGLKILQTDFMAMVGLNYNLNKNGVHIFHPPWLCQWAIAIMTHILNRQVFLAGSILG